MESDYQKIHLGQHRVIVLMRFAGFFSPILRFEKFRKLQVQIGHLLVERDPKISHDFG